MSDEDAKTKAARLNQERFDQAAIARSRKTGLKHYPEEHHIAPRLYRQAYEIASEHSGIPRVLDRGAGHTGLSTLPFLELGTAVTAVDVSGESLKELETRSEYHVVRGGVDGKAACATRTASGFDCTVYPYFWAALPPLRWFGIRTGALNTFGLFAVQRTAPVAASA